MPDLDLMEFRALSGRQLQVLSALEVDIYQRRRYPALAVQADAGAVPVAAGTEASAQRLWPGSESKLALAVARAAGKSDGEQFAAYWLALGETLPDLEQLRASAKRALWVRLRQRLAQG